MLNAKTQLPFYYDDFHFMPLAGRGPDGALPVWGWGEKSDFFFQEGHFEKWLSELRQVLSESSQVELEYQLNCLTLESLPHFLTHYLEFKKNHPQLNLYFKIEEHPSYLQLTLPQEWHSWLQDALNLEFEGKDQLIELTSNLPDGNSSEQLLAAFYYSVILKRPKTSVIKTFPRSLNLVKKSAEAFLKINPRSLLSAHTQDAVLSSSLLGPKIQEFFSTEIPGLKTREAKQEFLDLFLGVKDHIKCAHSDYEMMVILLELLKLPTDKAGILLEAGVFKGGSTIRLSLAADLLGRKLLAYDSFQGLPAHQETSPHLLYPPGTYLGSKEEVEANLKRYGRPEVVTLVEGWFDRTLPGLNQAVAMAFLDVDLATSTAECLKAIWPNLVEGGVIFSHDAHFQAVNELLHSHSFWENHFQQTPPRIEKIPGSSNLVKISVNK